MGKIGATFAYLQSNYYSCSRLEIIAVVLDSKLLQLF